LRYVFATIGITDLDFLLLEQAGRNEESQALATQRGKDWIATQLVQLDGRLVHLPAGRPAPQPSAEKLPEM
jgi:hypothetical protein